MSSSRITALPLDMQRIVIADAFRASLEVRDYPGAAVRSNDLDVVGVGPEQTARSLCCAGVSPKRLAAIRMRWLRSRPPQVPPIAVGGRGAAPARLHCARSAARSATTTRFVTSKPFPSPGRGDSIEVRALDMLSRLYAAKGRYSDAFGAVRPRPCCNRTPKHRGKCKMRRRHCSNRSIRREGGRPSAG